MDTIDPTFGPKGVIPSNATAWWSCRATVDRQAAMAGNTWSGLYNEVGIETHPDRMDAGGPAVEALAEWLNAGALKLIKDEVWRIYDEEQDRTDGGGAFGIVLGEDTAHPVGVGEYGILGYFRVVGGYFYIAVWAEPSDDSVSPDTMVEPSSPGGHPLKAWSGAAKGYPVPPKPGERIMVSMNDIGPAIVLRQTVVHGFIGLVVLPTNPPEWYRRQNGPASLGTVFGIELTAKGGSPSQPVVNHPAQSVGSEANLQAQAQLAKGEPPDSGMATVHDSITVEVPAPMSQALTQSIAGLWLTHGALAALTQYRAVTGSDGPTAEAAVAQVVAAMGTSGSPLEPRQYRPWGANETEGILLTDRERKLSEVYVVAYLPDGQRALLLNRQYAGLGVVHKVIADILTGETKVDHYPTPVVTSRWSDYSLDRDICGVPANTVFNAYWIAHPDSSDGRDALRRLAQDAAL